MLNAEDFSCISEVLMSTTPPESEYVSNLLSDAIDSVVQAQQLVDQIASRCAGWSLPYSLELQEAIERANKLSGYLQSLMRDAEAFDDASDEADEKV
jgi:hypothetical protein